MARVAFQKEEFEVLKQRLLLRQLDETPIWELHALIMQEADTAALLAQATPFPWLLFPCLFAERVRAATDLFHKQWIDYWQSVECAEWELHLKDSAEPGLSEAPVSKAPLPDAPSTPRGQSHPTISNQPVL